MPKVTQEHINKRKAEILAAAEQVFKKKGFEPTTMQDVVEASGMSRGGVYQYFSSPEEMLEAIHEQKIEEMTVYIQSLLKKHDTVWGAIEEYLHEEETDDEEASESSFGMITYEYSVVSWRNKHRREFMKKNFLKARNHLTALLQAGVDRGEFHPIQPLEAIVTFMINVTDGLILYAMVAKEEDFYLKEQIKGLKIYLRSVLQVREDHEK